MLPKTTANRIDEETPKRRGAEGGRFTGGTDDSGPMKPGNSVEEKTLKTRLKGINILKKKISMPPSGYSGSVIGIGETVDER
jgi:hypothetical protein